MRRAVDSTQIRAGLNHLTGGWREPSGQAGRFRAMGMIWFFIVVVLLAFAMFALSNGIQGLNRRRSFTDKDVDGEPDEPNGPAKDL